MPTEFEDVLTNQPVVIDNVSLTPADKGNAGGAGEKARFLVICKTAAKCQEELRTVAAGGASRPRPCMRCSAQPGGLMAPSNERLC